MAETTQVAEELQQETQPTVSENFANALWQDKPIEQVVQQTQEQTQPVEEKKDEEQQQNSTNQIDYNAFIKEQFNFENVDEAKAEIENLRKLKDQKPQFEFVNEDSKKLYEAFSSGKEDDIYNYLSKKKEVERLSSAEVNEQTALDILKLSIKSKNEDLTNTEVDFLLKKQYSFPKEPKQGLDELDDDFEARMNDWKEQVAEKKQEMIINAKLAKKEIEQLKSTIQLPTYEQKVESSIDPKELAKQEQLYKEFQSELAATVKNYQGINVKTKCEDAEILLTFSPKDDEKQQLQTKLNDFNVDDYFSPRWMTQDGKINSQKMMDDIYWLENKEAILQKIANESAAQMSLHIRQKNSNLKLNTDPTPTIPNTEVQQQRDALVKGIWSV